MPTFSLDFTRPLLLLMGLVALTSACGPGPGGGGDAGLDAPDSGELGGLRINEILADNEGVYLDNEYETEDYIELVNTGSTRVDLAGFTLSDGNSPSTLPSLMLEAGDRIVLFADEDLDQGPLHLDFKLSKDGESVVLADREGTILDEVTFPELGENEVFARFEDGQGEFERCRFASPDADNGAQCGPPEPPPIEVEPFDPYDFEADYPARVPGLSISELSLREASPFVLVENRGTSELSMASFAIGVAPHGPDEDWPSRDSGTLIDLESHASSLAPGAFLRVPLTQAELAGLASTEHFEGVATLFEGADAIDRVDFMAWPEGASLARFGASASFVFCADPSAAGEEGRASCNELSSREVPGRLRNLRTAGDFAALAAGGSALGVQAVKFVMDLERGGAVHFVSAEYALHYEFVREVIDGDPPLDRCDPDEAILFRQLWGQFSTEQYADPTGRRYLQGTLADYVTSGVKSIDFVTGDQILADSMRQAFFAVTARMRDGTEWSLRPQSDRQYAALRELEGTVPIVGQNAITAGVTFQPLNAAVAFGVLRFVEVSEIGASDLVGPGTILLTDAVPNDVPAVEGVITEVLQTPLSHVNILSRGRGIPNMALADARDDPRLAPYLDELVRLEVTGTGFEIEAATRAEAEAYWESRRPTGPRQVAPIDAVRSGIVDVGAAGMDDIPAIGAKAAQLGVLSRLVSGRSSCSGLIPTPDAPFAIPMRHYLEHFSESGAEAMLADAMGNDDFAIDVQVRREMLEAIADTIRDYPVDEALLALVESEMEARYGDVRVRFRSSSNVEDLVDFSGAGLYDSISAERGDEERRVDDAIRGVWASLWNLRAYDEREYANVDQTSVAMGVLVHETFRSELANGIGISRNVFDLTRNDMYYFNVQAGEAGVANPAPGVSSESYMYRWGRSPRIVYESRSSLTPFEVLTDHERDVAACLLRAIHDGFRPIVDPDEEERFFAMDIEWKLVEGRQIVVKQARPYHVGEVNIEGCHEF